MTTEAKHYRDRDLGLFVDCGLNPVGSDDVGGCFQHRSNPWVFRRTREEDLP